MKSTAPISSSGMAVSIKIEQGLEAPKLTLAKPSMLNTVKEEPVTAEVEKENKEPMTTEPVTTEVVSENTEPVTAEVVNENIDPITTEVVNENIEPVTAEVVNKNIDPVTTKVVNENGSVVKDFPDALKSLNGLFDLSPILSNFTCRFNDLQQHMECIAKSIDSLYKLQNIKESEVVAMVPKSNASTSDSSAALVLSSSKQIDKSIDDMYGMQNTKESQVVVMVPEPNASTPSSCAALVLSSSNQFDKSTEDTNMLQNSQSDVPVTVPEPNVSTSRSPDPPVLSSSNLIKSVVVAHETNASTSSPPVVRNLDNGRSCKKTSGVNLEVLCRGMASRAFRKYIQSQLSNVGKIREEAAAALKHAPDPAKLVLNSIGRFYLNSTKSYSYPKNSPSIIHRQGSLLILEIFLLSNCTSIESSIKKEAERGAIAWKKRLIKEGGFSNACIEDARGLLLLVASYGIPSDFSNEDLIELIRLSKAKEIAGALGQSRFLIGRICDIIQEMVEKKMYMTAAEVAHSVGVKEKLPPEKIMSTFLQEAKEACEIATSSKCSPEALKEATEKKLAAFKSVAKCLEDYKIDPAKITGCSIDTEIAEMEKLISDLGSAIEGKRNAYVNDNNVIEFGRQQTSHVKKATPVKGNPDVDTAVGGKRKAYVNNNVTPFVASEAKQPRTSGVVSPQIHNTGAAPLHRTNPGNGDETRAWHAAALGGAFSVAPPVHYGNGGAWSHAWHSDGPLNDNSLRHGFVGNPMGQGFLGHPPSSTQQGFLGHPPSSSQQGFPVHPPPVSSAQQGFPGHPLPASSTQGFTGHPPPASSTQDFPGHPSTSMGIPLSAGFPGHPSTPVGVASSRSSTSLYQFADSL